MADFLFGTQTIHFLSPKIIKLTDNFQIRRWLLKISVINLSLKHLLLTEI